jgi:DNA-binding MarR family transcriptional regulator
MNVNDRARIADSLYEFLVAVGRRAGTSLVEVLEESGLTAAQLKSLAALGPHDEFVSVGSLAERLGVSQPTASRLAQSLAAHGFVVSAVSEHDRRGRELSLTGEGQALLERVREARVADLRVFVDGLTADACRRLADALASLRLEGAE